MRENWMAIIQIVKKYPCTLQKVSSKAHLVENIDANTNGTTRTDKPENKKKMRYTDYKRFPFYDCHKIYCVPV
jgi:hypothetical protein